MLWNYQFERCNLCAALEAILRVSECMSVTEWVVLSVQ